MSKTTASLGFSACLFCLAQVVLLVPAAAQRPVRSPNAPGTPPLTPAGFSGADSTQLNTAFKKLLSENNPAVKAIFDKYPAYNPLTVAGGNPPANVDGNFLVGPNYVEAPELTVNPTVPHGRVERFVMNSEDSKFYPGIGKSVPFGDLDPNNPKTVLIPSVHPMPYKRTVTVYIPAQYVAGAAAPFIVTADGPETILPPILDNMIAQRRLPAMVAVMIQNGGFDAQGSERGLEYDTMSGKYAEFVEAEVLPQVEKLYNVKLTKDPEGRATMGGSSGGSCALIMAWYHPDLYHRVITYSGTYVNQQWPFNPETPDGAWDFHEHLIPESPVKPIRLWMSVGDNDLYNPNIMRDGMHDWVEANNRMATVLKAKGYHYQYLFAQNSGHVDRNLKAQTLPEALEWVWQGYPKDAAQK